MSPARYHPALVTLHWLLAVMIAFALLTGMIFLAKIENASPDKINALRVHMIIGVLTLLRLAVRFGAARPDPVRSGKAFFDRMASWTHFLLYALVLVMAASGIAMAVQADLPAIVFASSGGALPESFSIYVPRRVHGAVAIVLLVLVVLHFVAALHHQFVLRDGLFARMGYRGPR